MLGCKGLTPRSTGHLSSPHNIHKLYCKQEMKMLKMAARNEILVMWKRMKMKQYLKKKMKTKYLSSMII